MSNEERGHALSLIGYQNMRGGFVVLDALKKPEIAFQDIPSSLNFALKLEKNNTAEFTRLHEIAHQQNDLITMDLIASIYLKEQAASVQLIRNMLAQLKSSANDSIIQQLMNNQLQRKFGPKCSEDLMRLTSENTNM